MCRNQDTMWKELSQPEKKAACYIITKSAMAVDAGVPLADCDEDITAHSFQQVIDLLTPLVRQLASDQKIYVVDDGCGVGLRLPHIAMNWAAEAELHSIASSKQRRGRTEAIDRLVEKKCEAQKAHPELAYRHSEHERCMSTAGQGTDRAFGFPRPTGMYFHVWIVSWESWQEEERQKYCKLMSEEIRVQGRVEAVVIIQSMRERPDLIAAECGFEDLMSLSAGIEVCRRGCKHKLVAYLFLSPKCRRAELKRV